jgi:hypothetical protein
VSLTEWYEQGTSGVLTLQGRSLQPRRPLGSRDHCGACCCIAALPQLFLLGTEGGLGPHTVIDNASTTSSPIASSLAQAPLAACHLNRRCKVPASSHLTLPLPLFPLLLLPLTPLPLRMAPLSMQLPPLVPFGSKQYPAQLNRIEDSRV